VAVETEVRVTVLVGVAVLVSVYVAVGVRVRVGVLVAVAVRVAVDVGVSVGETRRPWYALLPWPKRLLLRTGWAPSLVRKIIGGVTWPPALSKRA
jgi:hypothetical protein